MYVCKSVCRSRRLDRLWIIYRHLTSISRVLNFSTLGLVWVSGSALTKYHSYMFPQTKFFCSIWLVLDGILQNMKQAVLLHPWPEPAAVGRGASVTPKWRWFSLPSLLAACMWSAGAGSLLLSHTWSCEEFRLDYLCHLHHHGTLCGLPQWQLQLLHFRTPAPASFTCRL